MLVNHQAKEELIKDILYWFFLFSFEIREGNNDILDLQKLSEEYYSLLFEEKTPLKCGLLTHTNLNWFRIIKQIDKKNVDIEDIKEKINIFKKSSSGTARKYIDNTLSLLEKIENKL